MAKQTFTTGQVLTAAQMTSLQQTAMGGGSATAKTASYVLVAADAGGTVAMNAAGATTITVNTALFAAGDTVFIQNLGAGACTVTAGTATVASAGSLILPQYDAGILYFTATGASIFYDYIQAGAASPLTTKGDVYTFSTSDARLGVGANNTVLTADSAAATGLKWAAAASSGFVGCSLYNTTSQSLTNNTLTAVTFDVEYFDTNTFHDNSTNPTRVTIPSGKGGKYQINFFTSGDGGYSGIWETFLYKNGSSIFGAAVTPSLTSPYNFGACPTLVGVWEFAAADYFEIFMRQTKGSTISIYTTAAGGYLNATYLGA